MPRTGAVDELPFLGGRWCEPRAGGHAYVSEQPSFTLLVSGQRTARTPSGQPLVVTLARGGPLAAATL